MKYLLDTHILMWMLTGDEQIGKEVKELIMDQDNQIYYSAVSPWEIEIKHLKYPEQISVSGEEFNGFCEQAGFIALPIAGKYVGELKNIRQIDNNLKHNDPFDKMLLAQARYENMVLITHDRKFKNYDDPHLLLC